MGVVAEIDATEKRTLFADSRKFELFGGAREKDGRIVAEDAGEDLIGYAQLARSRIHHLTGTSDHDNCNGEQDPVAEPED